MTDSVENDSEKFSRRMEQIENRKLRAQRRKKQSPWMGIGLFGVVGWTIVTPTVLGVLLGYWLDKKYPQTFSWTLSLLIAGLILGCVMAWRWIRNEQKEMNDNNGIHE